MIEKLKEIKNKYNTLVEKLSDPEIMSDISAYQKLAKEQKHLTPIIEAFDKYEKLRSDVKSAREILQTERDPDIIQMAEMEIAENEETLARIEEQLKILLIPRDERDDNNVIMEIRPAAGGDEAALFAAALMRMYNMYATSNGFRVEMNDIAETEIGGIKEAVFTISGDSAFSRFKYESGVHRVQRVPDTETQGRIHTSTCTVAVLPEATTVDFKIEEKDLKVDTYRASGAGGQHVNRTESAIRITHLPTGMVVTCQDGRSQIQNRAKAMLILQTKLADHYQGAADAQYAATRKNQVGTGDRSERIRTYNYPQGRITDHRIGFTVYNLPAFMNGDIGELMEALKIADNQAKLLAE
jgi:peptide chain release factor 1